MAKQIKQWLMVNDEIYRTVENMNKYNALLHWNVRHPNASLSENTIKNRNCDKIMYIITIEVQDNEYDFNQFCDMADKVNGLYCVSDIIANASRVLDAKSNQE